MSGTTGNPEGPGAGIGRISLLRIERYLNGELGEAETAEVQAEADRVPELRAYLENRKDLRAALPLERLVGPASRRKREVPAGMAVLGEWLARLRAPAVSLATLLLAAGIWTLWPGSRDAGLTAKGSGGAEVRLRVGGESHRPGAEASATPGDTLVLLFRSERPLRGQIWYREDDDVPVRLAEERTWEASTALAPAAPPILLEGEWRRQILWVLLSDSPLDSAAALSALRRPESSPARVDSFAIRRAE